MLCGSHKLDINSLMVADLAAGRRRFSTQSSIKSAASGSDGSYRQKSVTFSDRQLSMEGSSRSSQAGGSSCSRNSSLAREANLRHLIAKHAARGPSPAQQPPNLCTDLSRAGASDAARSEPDNGSIAFLQEVQLPAVIEHPPEDECQEPASSRQAPDSLECAPVAQQPSASKGLSTSSSLTAEQQQLDSSAAHDAGDLRVIGGPADPATCEPTAATTHQSGTNVSTSAPSNGESAPVHSCQGMNCRFIVAAALFLYLPPALPVCS